MWLWKSICVTVIQTFKLVDQTHLCDPSEESEKHSRFFVECCQSSKLGKTIGLCRPSLRKQSFSITPTPHPPPTPQSCSDLPDIKSTAATPGYVEDMALFSSFIIALKMGLWAFGWFMVFKIKIYTNSYHALYFLLLKFMVKCQVIFIPKQRCTVRPR